MDISYAQCGDPDHEGIIIINEVSQGRSPQEMEFIELLVVGNSLVNLEGFIIDDNNEMRVDRGNEPGHIRFGDCFDPVKPGTLIVIYNDKYGFSLPPSSEYLILIPFSSDCLIKVGPCPSHFTSSYDCFDNTSLETNLWADYIPLRNLGDKVQVISPTFENIHTISWGNVTHTPVEIFMGYSDVIDRSIVFGGGKNEYTNPAKYQKLYYTNASPGSPNSADNLTYINELRNAPTDFFEMDLRVGERDAQSVEVQFNNGVAPYNISLSQDGSIINSYSSSTDFFFIPYVECGQYDVAVTDANGCTLNETIKIVNPTEFRFTVKSDSCTTLSIDPFCLNCEENCCYEWRSTLTDTVYTEASPTICASYGDSLFTLKVMDENGEVTDEVDVRLDIEIICNVNELEVTKNLDTFAFDKNTIPAYPAYNSFNQKPIKYIPLGETAKMELKVKPSSAVTGGLKLKSKDNALTFSPTVLVNEKTTVNINYPGNSISLSTSAIMPCDTMEEVIVQGANRQTIMVEFHLLCETDNDITTWTDPNIIYSSERHVCVDPGPDGLLDGDTSSWIRGDDRILYSSGKYYVVAGPNKKCESSARSHRDDCPSPSYTIIDLVTKANNIFKQIGIEIVPVNTTWNLLYYSYDYFYTTDTTYRTRVDGDNENNKMSGYEQLGLVSHIQRINGKPEITQVWVVEDIYESTSTVGNNSGRAVSGTNSLILDDTYGNHETLVHELIHAKYRIRHPKDNDPNNGGYLHSGDSDNIMYYTKTGRKNKFRQYLWEIIYAPTR